MPSAEKGGLKQRGVCLVAPPETEKNKTGWLADLG